MSDFVTCLNCIDGRVQLPVIRWIQEKSGAPYVDMITRAGMDGRLADPRFTVAELLLQKPVEISLEVHGSREIYVVAHHDCAGNPVTKEEHIAQLHLAVIKLKKLFPQQTVTAIWVSEQWEVEEVVSR